ncbi:6988_t:CDS:2 [Paraglomus brasilianum]|uniref:Sulfhydryl oxidase n=1 Tax=Paraglomus brasilianum TaxID=144538 RepID=A0A9N9A3R8_9GLOM|nr:6988_t:CDS:2 [Paraglomus brasilianum]
MRGIVGLTVITFLVIIPTLVYFNSNLNSTYQENINYTEEFPTHLSENVDQNTVHGGVIMPKLGNATIKAELGRSSWKLLHTMMARFPERPTKDQKAALRSFIYLFSRLYPCGECAKEFQMILEKHPPQVSSREAASLWACAVHNIVNRRLLKEEFDCSTVADKYKCGCAAE